MNPVGWIGAMCLKRQNIKSLEDLKDCFDILLICFIHIKSDERIFNYSSFLWIQTLLSYHILLPISSFVFSAKSFPADLPGFCPDACAWPAPAGPPAGCGPWRSSGRPRCRAAAGADGSPPSPEPTGPAWSSAGGRARLVPDSEEKKTIENLPLNNVFTLRYTCE